VITVAETFLGTRQTRAIIEGRVIHAANWAALFEFVLVVDIWLLVSERWLVVPIVAGAWWGVYLNRRSGS
jgi:hypothetical protein